MESSVFASRHFQVAAIKSLFDQLIDQHAEAYLAAYPEIKEFSGFEKSGTYKYYIGMVWTNDNEKPNTEQLRIRGSQMLTQNKMVELDLSFITSQESFFPGQIIAFLAEPFLKRQLTVKNFLDPMKIAPPMKRIDTDDNIRLVIASGPYMKPEHDDWVLFDNLIASIKDNGATHIVLIGPFVDIENKLVRSTYDTNWNMVFNKLVEGLHEQACNIYLVPSSRDVLSSERSTCCTYPCPEFSYKLNLKKGAKPKCKITPVSDPSQIDLGGLYLDVTSAEILFNLNKSTSFINKDATNHFDSLYRHILTHGIYPLYPSPTDIAIDYPKLENRLKLDRLGPHIVVLPTKFNTSITEVDSRVIVAIQKCCTRKQMVMIEIPKIESSDEFPVNSVVSSLPPKIVDLSPEVKGESLQA